MRDGRNSNREKSSRRSSAAAEGDTRDVGGEVRRKTGSHEQPTKMETRIGALCSRRLALDANTLLAVNPSPSQKPASKREQPGRPGTQANLEPSIPHSPLLRKLAVSVRCSALVCLVRSWSGVGQKIWTWSPSCRRAGDHHCVGVAKLIKAGQISGPRRKSRLTLFGTVNWDWRAQHKKRRRSDQVPATLAGTARRRIRFSVS